VAGLERVEERVDGLRAMLDRDEVAGPEPTAYGLMPNATRYRVKTKVLRPVALIDAWSVTAVPWASY
jgi:hypothetical protein